MIETRHDIKTLQTYPFTFAMIKSHVYRDNDSFYNLLGFIEDNKFRVITRRDTDLPLEEICEFYHEHRGAPYWMNLYNSVNGGVSILLLYSNVWDNCIAEFRKLMGPTNPLDASENTIRGKFGDKTSGIIANNAIHGSDSPESFQREMALFFGFRA